MYYLYINISKIKKSFTIDVPTSNNESWNGRRIQETVVIVYIHDICLGKDGVIQLNMTTAQDAYLKFVFFSVDNDRRNLLVEED